jgi:hypothetical protein
MKLSLAELIAPALNSGELSATVPPFRLRPMPARLVPLLAYLLLQVVLDLLVDLVKTGSRAFVIWRNLLPPESIVVLVSSEKKGCCGRCPVPDHTWTRRVSTSRPGTSKY